MLQIGNALVSTDLIDTPFVCDLERCKGACCVQGDSGAPLEADELEQIERAFPAVRDMLQPEALASIDEIGLHTVDTDGDCVTPLVNGNRECVYTVFENGIASCAFEKAYNQGLIGFRKPVSCHLYPVRIEKHPHYDAVNYHKWSVCAPACSLGKKLDVPLYVFLKDSLTRKYGSDWYQELCEVAEAYRKHREG